MKKLKLAVAAAMVVGAGLFAAPGVANAALSDCASNDMCMWGNNDYRWLIAERDHGKTSWTNVTGEANNEMDSWANRSASWTGCMAGSTGGDGDRQTMAKNSSDNNVAVFNSDEVSSWRTGNGC